MTLFDTTAAASALRAQALLRDPQHFQWYLLPLLLLTLYVYAEQIRAQRGSVVLGGLAFWCMDWINEIGNALIFHFTAYAPIWATPGETAYQLLIGLNSEISLMFAVLGVAALLLLPADPRLRILGVNNRWLFAVVNSLLAVGIECLLNAAGALSWEYAYWNRGFPYLIVLFGYLPFFAMAYWVHDMTDRRRQLRTVGLLAGFVILSLTVFGGILGWL